MNVPDKANICTVRKQMDKVMEKAQGIKFFISCITGTMTNGPKAKLDFSAGISYFLCYVKNKCINEEKIFAMFHDNGMEIEISKIKTRNVGKSSTSDIILVQLKQVVKVLKFIKSIFLNVLVLKIQVSKIKKSMFYVTI